MQPFVRRFLRASLVWFGVGVAIGVSMAFAPWTLSLRPAHVHANLLGFVSMMIFGVAYHVVPRFTGNPLHRPGLATAHLWVANLGLVLLVGGWIGRTWSAAPGALAVRLGAALSAIGAAFFIFNIWRTLGPAGRSTTCPSTPPLSNVRASTK